MANKLTIDSLNKVLNTIGVLLERVYHNEPKWFICFGTLLGLIRDKGIIEGDTDIDIGIFQEDINEKQIFSIMERYDYKCTKIIRLDNTDKTITKTYQHPTLAYACFEHKTMPCIDMFGWYKWGDYRFHTYDYYGEGKEYPSKYYWKGVESRYFEKMAHSRFGTRTQDLLIRHVSYPMWYGHLLDLWYPDWKTPRKGESVSPYCLEMKSCKKFEDKVWVNE